MSESPITKSLPNRHPSGWRQRFDAYWRLIRADRPIGIYLLLWPALWALWVAGEGTPAWRVVVVFVVGTALMRSAGCAINDYADRHFDGAVERTRTRPLAAGEITPTEAVIVFATLALGAFALVLTLDAKTIAHSFIAVTLAAAYPFTKRYTHMPQVVLGMAFGWAVPMAFTALRGEIPPVAWLMFVATVVWAVIYDTMYAMVDRDDDLRIGIKSTAILFGAYDRIIIAGLQVLMLGLLILVGGMAGRGWCFNVGLGVAGAFFGYQQYLIRDRDRGRCLQAFLNNNFVGMTIFVALLLDYLLR